MFHDPKFENVQLIEMVRHGGFGADSQIRKLLLMVYPAPAASGSLWAVYTLVGCLLILMLFGCFLVMSPVFVSLKNYYGFLVLLLSADCGDCIG